MNQGGDQELENLVTKLAILKDLLSSIEKKVHTRPHPVMCRPRFLTHDHLRSGSHTHRVVLGCVLESEKFPGVESICMGGSI